MKYILSAIALIAMIMMVVSFGPSVANATPGAVNAQGCHKDHCHKKSSLNKYKNGRKYVAGNFPDHKKRRRYKR